MICVVMLAEFFVVTFGLPAFLKLLPELISIAVTIFVIAAGVGERFRYVAGSYWLAFGFMAIIIASGVISNQVGPGPIIAGMRYYLRAIPFFFLPAVFDFSDRQIGQQLKLLLFLGLVQIPISVYQRWVIRQEGRFTGDEVFGTMQISSILSIFLICAVLVIVGFRLRDRIGKWAAFLLAFLLLVPTTINETKGTVVLLPLGLFVALTVGVRPGQRFRVAVWAAALLVSFGVIFVPVYDYLNKDRPYAVSITEFFTDTENIERYVEKDSAGVGTTEEAGRLDAILVPYEYISRDPIRMLFGLGIGNASHSQLASGFIGEYYQLFKLVALSSASKFLLEIGLLGTGTVFLLYWLVFRDSLALSRSDSELRGALAIGWSAIVVIFALGTFYKNIHTFESLSYLFWYFAGIIASTRMRRLN
jgi:hypothetical protein